MPVMSRRAIRILAAVLVLSGLVYSLSAQMAHACDFEEPPPPDEAMDNATAVFSGEVIDIVEQEDDPDIGFYDVHFQVDRVWKGISDAEVVVETYMDEAICGYPFQESERYLVYAHGPDDDLITALFHRTTPLDRADEDLATLGEGTPVEEIVGEAQVEADDEGQEFAPWILLSMLILVGLLAAGVILIRRARAAAIEDEDLE
jgi:hypothetical protein